MSELKTLSPEILIHIATLLHVPMKGLLATVELLDEGATVPFIARYRKEATGNLDEVQIRAIEEKLLYFRELESRKATILASIQEQGKLTDELKARIEATLEQERARRSVLPYKPKRRTKATIAREKGLEPLADICGNSKSHRHAARNICGDFCRRGKRRGERRGSARRRAPHRGGDDQRRRRHPQAAAPRHVRGRRHRQQENRSDAVDEQAEVQDVLRLSRAGRSRSPRTACWPSAAARPKTSSTS